MGRLGPWHLYRAGCETRHFATRALAIEWLRRVTTRRRRGLARGGALIEHETTDERWRQAPWGDWQLVRPAATDALEISA